MRGSSSMCCSFKVRQHFKKGQIIIYIHWIFFKKKQIFLNKKILIFHSKQYNFLKVSLILEFLLLNWWKKQKKILEFFFYWTSSLTQTIQVKFQTKLSMNVDFIFINVDIQISLRISQQIFWNSEVNNHINLQRS
jgi:hypothetical protein